MRRSLLLLTASLLACAALAAPAPTPQPFVSGWEKPVDPDKDCAIRREKDALIMEMPGRDHDYDPCRGQLNAPQLIREREIEGDFTMQVRVRVDCQPSVQSTVDGQPSSVSAGFLVILPKNSPGVCIRMEFRASRKGSGVDRYIDTRRWVHHQRQGGRIIEGAKSFERGWKGDVYLRLERRDDDLRDSMSSDGENWKRLGIIGGIRQKLKVGLAAYSTSTELSRIQFDQFKLTQERRKKQ